MIGETGGQNDCSSSVLEYSHVIRMSPMVGLDSGFSQFPGMVTGVAGWCSTSSSHSDEKICVIRSSNQVLF